MIRGLFCHYLPIYKDVNGKYCSTTLTNTFFERYFCAVDVLYVATRVYPLNKTYKEAHQEIISHKNVKIIEFPNLSSFKGLTQFSKSKKRIYSIAKKMDMIFIRGGIIALLGVDAARKINKPYLVECAGCAWDEYWNYSLFGKMLAPYMEYRTKRDTKNAAFVIYVTEKWLQRRYPTMGKSTYASNVILEDIDESALSKRLEKIKSDNQTKIRIGTTGGIGNKSKGQQFVIRAMSKLKKDYDITYELVGGGDDKFLKTVAKRFNLQDKVIFKGQLTHDEVLKWLDGLDYYIQPSMQEGLPRALIEAMSRACPAIGSTTGGIPELLDDDYIFKRGSIRDLVNIFRNVLGKNLEKIAIKNFEKSKEYQIAVLNKRREKIYKEYLKFVKGDLR